MRLYFALQRPEAALKQFAACRQILNAELALEPEIETVALAQEITQRSGVSPALYLLATLLPMPLALDDARLAQIPPSDARTNARNEDSSYYNISLVHHDSGDQQRAAHPGASVRTDARDR